MADIATLRVLVVDDDPAMVMLVRKLLLDAGYQQITVAASGHDALEHASRADLILLDHQLPDTTGIELLPRLVARADPPSVIMITGEGNETLAASALRAGADDYLAKDGKLRGLLPEIVERVRRNRALRATQTAVERELVRAERLAAIGEMTVTLHHEINNPLMSAAAEIELLSADASLTPSQRESVDSIRAGLGRIRTIIKQAGELRQASSQDYLAGLRMINLHATDRSATLSRGRAMLWIAEEDVARLAALVLRHSGFTVERAGSARELQGGAARLGVVLVVLSVLGTTDPAEALNGFVPEANRGYGIAALVSGDPTAARAAGADRVVQLPLDPATLSDELLAAFESRAG